MEKTTLPASGRFVWHDLMTTDVETSAQFYCNLFGWITKEVDMGRKTGKYTMIGLGDKSIGGFEKLAKGENVASHWIGYVTTDDIGACVERAQRHGGKVCVPVTEIPNTGRFAIVTDPTGAVLSPFQFGGDPMPEAEGHPPIGDFCWDELLTTDPKRAAAFYGEMFGWSSEAMDMGRWGTYHLQKRGSKDAAGMLQLPKDVDAPPHWITYVHVTDVDAITAKARQLGGTIHREPTDIPNIGRFAVLADPTGAVFGIFKGAGS